MTIAPPQTDPAEVARRAERSTRRTLRIVTLSVTAAMAAATAYVLAFNPTDKTADPTGPCLFHELFGINGPMCGGTRMYWHLIHGDVIEAFRHHAPALLLAPVLLYCFVWAASRGWFGRTLPTPRPSRRLLIGYAIAWLAFTVVLRNLPGFEWFDIEYLG